MEIFTKEFKEKVSKCFNRFFVWQKDYVDFPYEAHMECLAFGEMKRYWENYKLPLDGDEKKSRLLFHETICDDIFEIYLFYNYIDKYGDVRDTHELIGIYDGVSKKIEYNEILRKYIDQKNISNEVKKA